MDEKTLWDERLGMLMACGSPGSALAYHLGQITFKPMMVRRGTVDRVSSRSERPHTTDARPEQMAASKAKGWLGRLWDRLEAWSWHRHVREREAYLAQATDLAELETRMRRLDGDAQLSRARALY